MAKAVASRHMTIESQRSATNATWISIRVKTYQRLKGKSYGKTPIGKQ
jgi:hypothetical protein